MPQPGDRPIRNIEYGLIPEEETPAVFGNRNGPAASRWLTRFKRRFGDRPASLVTEHMGARQDFDRAAVGGRFADSIPVSWPPLAGRRSIDPWSNHPSVECGYALRR
jgi:hypothetical protein